jgi:hypothetical protein
LAGVWDEAGGGGIGLHHPALRDLYDVFSASQPVTLNYINYLVGAGHCGSSISQGQKLLGLASAVFAGLRTVIFFIV